MRLRSITVTFLAALTACGSAVQTDTGYGSFVHAAPATHETRLAEDAARQLTLLYPPASTRLTLAHATQDPFGALLMEKLRGQGYALKEVAASADASLNETATTSNDGVSFSYVLDTVAAPRLYRVTLNVGRQSISRAYIAQNDLIHPAGAWVRKE